MNAPPLIFPHQDQPVGGLQEQSVSPMTEPPMRKRARRGCDAPEEPSLGLCDPSKVIHGLGLPTYTELAGALSQKVPSVEHIRSLCQARLGCGSAPWYARTVSMALLRNHHVCGGIP